MSDHSADHAALAREMSRRAKAASRALAVAGTAAKDRWLHAAADAVRTRVDVVLEANGRDVAAAPDYGLTDAQVDRLRLTPDRLERVAAALEQVAALPDPVGEVLGGGVRPNGLELLKLRVPLGVVFFIYESRPNVTADAAALCVKSGNAVILRGGKEALHSNTALHGLLSEALTNSGLPGDAVQLVPTTDRAAVGEFLKRSAEIDVAIPRGGRSLIERVAREAAMPVLKHFDGVCHVFLDASADPAMAEAITVNAKCQRPGVCNAAETLLVHRDCAADLLPPVAAALKEEGVELRGCPRTREILGDVAPATEEDWGTEYLSLTLSVKVVDSVADAAAHVNRYGSGHTDAIVTRDLASTRYFEANVDSAAVIVNASTRFNDGGEFGLGAEIGISTDKLHARGPCGLRELTSYKYLVRGDGQVRG